MRDRTCSIAGCGDGALARGWCNKHYKRWRKYGDPTELVRNFQGGQCQVDGCDNKPSSLRFCPKHRYRFVRYGDPHDIGNAERARAERELRPPTRTIDANGYARLYIDRRWVYEHRHVWEAAHGPIPDGYHVHHANHARDDNRLDNLQLVYGREHNRRHTSQQHASGDRNNRGANSPRYRTDLDDKLIVHLVDDGVSYRKIAALMCASPHTIANHYKRSVSGEGNDDE